MTKRNFSFHSNAVKLLANLSKATSAKDDSWLAATIHFLTRLHDISIENKGIGLKVLRTDGLYVYYKDQMAFYIHMRIKHILFHTHEDCLFYEAGDRFFGADSRQEGSWARMWKVSSQDGLERAISFLSELEVVDPDEGQEESRSIPSWVKNFVKERDDGKCRVCGSTRNLHFDHIYPFSWGGGNDPKNIQLLCSEHNLEKSASLKY